MDAVPPPVQVVTDNVSCTRCGYSLRGLAVTSKCPECAWSVDASLRGGLLRYSGPEYLESLVRGCTIVIYTNIVNAVVTVVLLAAVITAIVLGGGVLVIPPAPSGSGAATPAPANPALAAIENLDAIAMGFSVLATAASLIGYWLLTAPDPATAASEQPRAARRVARAATAASAVIQAGALATEMLSPGLGPSPRLLVFLSTSLTAVGALATAVHFFSMVLYIRWLGRRVPDQKLTDRASLFMWLLPVLVTVGSCVAVGPLVAWVLYVVLLWQLRIQLRLAREQSLTLATN